MRSLLRLGRPGKQAGGSTQQRTASDVGAGALGSSARVLPSRTRAPPEQAMGTPADADRVVRFVADDEPEDSPPKRQL